MRYLERAKAITFKVDSHRKNLLAKLNVKNTATLIKLAVEHKLI